MADATVEVDVELLNRALRLRNSDDARAMIEEELRAMIKRREAQLELAKLRGKIQWDDDLDETRKG